jgi:hypothetical protein
MMIFKVGDLVRLTSVDLYGFNGRDFHPGKSDVGFIGVVVQADVEEPHTDEDEGIILCYRVCRPSDGKVLDLMSHEVEAALRIRV